MKKVKNILRNEKGLTLIELLAVVVILGIIAAIAIPAIANIISNSKEDAHVANAEQLINAARLAVADGFDYTSTKTPKVITENELIASNYLESIKDPDGEQYTKAQVTVDDKGKVIKVELGEFVAENKDASKAADGADVPANNQLQNIEKAFFGE